MNFMLVVEEKVPILLGIYPTRQAAQFIQQVVKNRNAIDATIYPTNYKPTTTYVENYLNHMKNEKRH